MKRSNSSLKYLSRTIFDNLVNHEDRDWDDIFYLLQHGVLNDMSNTTRLRVVFDGSSKSFNATSLNDVLLVEPPLQDDFFGILLRFVFKADIRKMY